MNDMPRRAGPDRTLRALIVMTILVVILAGVAAFYLYGIAPLIFPRPS